jgi:hypothetical protein
MRVNTFAIRFHRANIVALRVSKIRPITRTRGRPAGALPGRRRAYLTDPLRAPAPARAAAQPQPRFRYAAAA